MIIAEKNDGIMKLDNGIFIVSYNMTENIFSVRSGGKLFLKEGRLENNSATTAKIIELKDGKAIEIKCPSGKNYMLALYEDSPFIFIKAGIHNPKTKTITIDKNMVFRADIDLGVPANNLRVLGCDGVHPAEESKESYVFLAIAEPETRAGVVCGWLTDDRASGIASSRKKDDLVSIGGWLEYGKLTVKAGETVEGETLVLGLFDDALVGLEAYADAIAKANKIKLPKVPSGYCTWYHAGASDEKRMAELADFCGKNLRQYGFDFLQIDDGWQISRRDFTTHNPDGAYHSGAKATAESIKSHGFKAGLWITPFGWDHTRPTFAEHQDWFVKKAEDGSVYSVTWGGDCLDMSHPEAREFLRGVIEKVTKEWGYEYLKLDALWTGVAVKILYPDPTYRDDGLGDAIFHAPTTTNVEAFRNGLKLVREAAGEDVFLLGCTISQNMRTFGGSFGLVDAIRIGRDIGAKWQSILPCAMIGAHLYFLNGKVWHNDPDCLMLRDPLTLDQARAWGSWIAVSGQMNVVSEWLPGLPPEKLDIVKRTMPNTQKLGRPIDLFESPVPQIWHLKAGEREIIGLFNWDAGNELSLNVDLAKLDLSDSPNDQYVGFDFWENEFVHPFTETLEVDLRPSSCRVIAISRMLERPQLVSTSRHVTQGLLDVIEENWDERENTFSGKSKVVGDDLYELRIFAPNGDEHWQAASAIVSEKDQHAGVTAEIKQSGSEIRVMICSPKNRNVSWSVSFGGGSQT